MIDKRIFWSIVGCLLWTFCFVILAFVPELAKMPEPVSTVNPLVNPSSTPVGARDWLHDFREFWIAGWVGACFCSAIIVDAVVEAFISADRRQDTNGWSIQDVSTLSIILLFVSTVLIFSTKKYALFTPYIDWLLFAQIVLGTIVKFTSFKPKSLTTKTI
jgi:hypothetical protein